MADKQNAQIESPAFFQEGDNLRVKGAADALRGTGLPWNEAALADLERIAAVIERSLALVDVGIRKIEVVDGKIEMDLTVAQEILRMWAGSALAMLDGAKAENCLEMLLAHPELKGTPVTLTLQRHPGKTPMQLRTEAEQRTAAILSGLNALLSKYDTVRIDGPGFYNDVHALVLDVQEAK